MSETETSRGRIVTFYSYKGGTGRSMALANVAWILATQGFKVLAIDWDLEAPGLHRYFQPFLRDPLLASCEGVMDFVVDFSAAAVSAPQAGDQADGSLWFQPYADLRRYAFSLEWDGFPKGGTLDFVPAGRQDAGYPVRVNSFNWQHFYDKLGGGIFLEETKRQLRQHYDYVLVDSRTGVSDTSGVCTVQMPDDLVACFTLNQQSIEGTNAAASSALQQRRRQDGSPGLRVLPLPTRVDLSEKERLDLARAEAWKRFDPFLDEWLDDDQRHDYWGGVEVPYVPFYALEEVLATFGDSPGQTKSVLASMESLTAWITERRIAQLRRVDESLRVHTLQQFLRKPEVKPGAAGGDYLAYLSCATEDDTEEMRRFVSDLAEEVASRTGHKREQAIFMDVSAGLLAVRLAALEPARLRATMNSCAVMISMVTPAYANSKFAREEQALFRATSRPIIQVQWIPTQQSTEVMEGQFFPLEGQAAKEGLRTVARLTRYREEYQSTLIEIAKQVTDHVWRDAVRLKRDIVVGPPASFKKRPREAAPPSTPKIQFVIVAERADAIRAVRANARSYGVRRRDWRPFWSIQREPDEVARNAGEIAAQLETELSIKVETVSLHGFEQWMKRKTKPPGHELILLVDPWTALMPDHRKLLRTLTHHGDVACTIIVCFDRDSETRKQSARLRENLDAPDSSSTESAGESTFPNRRARLLFADSPDELWTHMREAHAYLRAAALADEGVEVEGVTPTA